MMLNPRHLLQCCAALSALPLLGGCIAAAIMVPTLAGMGYIWKGNPIRAATPRPDPETLTQQLVLTPASGVTLTTLTELPPPSGLQPMAFSDPAWESFVTYAREQAAGLAAEGPIESALLAPQGAAALAPIRQTCEERTPAILIDLDNGDTVFSGLPADVPPAGLAADLDRLRQAGVVIVWISRAPANDVAAIGEVLFRSKLDPTGRDPLLLAKNPEQRKQTLREEANRDVCILAIAGDERSDFDELFAYLRGPQDATLLEPMLGAGWFLVPPPLTAPAAVPEPAPLPAP